MVTRLGDLVKIALAEMPQFQVSPRRRPAHCTGERARGGRFQETTDGGELVCGVLSDGMGAAARRGGRGDGLRSDPPDSGRFLPGKRAEMVNSALLVKSGDESLSTLDIVELDLFTGRIEPKAGAAPSLLCSMGEPSRIDLFFLPVGILRDIAAERSSDTLVGRRCAAALQRRGDGRWTEWIEETLREIRIPRRGRPRKLAEEIAAEDRLSQGGTGRRCDRASLQVKQRNRYAKAARK